MSLDLTERLLPLTFAALAALGFTPRPSARPLPPFRWHLPADTAERAPHGLFDSADPIEITLAADFDAVAKDRGTEKRVHAGVLSYGSPAGDTVSLNVQLHTRGHFRLRTCEFPPLKLEFDRTLSVPALAQAIDDVEARVRAVVPSARVMYVEPDVHHATSDVT